MAREVIALVLIVAGVICAAVAVGLLTAPAAGLTFAAVALSALGVFFARDPHAESDDTTTQTR